MAMTLQQLKTRAKSTADRLITKAGDRELNQDKFQEQVLRNSKIDSPEIRKEQLAYKIDKAIARMGHMPDQFSYTPGEYYHYAHYEVPISGDPDIAANLFVPRRFVSYLDGMTLHYKYFSIQPITGNDTILSLIKDQAKAFLAKVERDFDTFKEEAEAWNNGELQDYIKAGIALEIKRRNVHTRSLEKLNPFD